MSDVADQWREWIDQVCAAVGVDPDAVRPGEVLGLAGVVSREVVRPMAPVSAFIWGLAVATHPDADPESLRVALLDCARSHPGTFPSPGVDVPPATR